MTFESGGDAREDRYQIMGIINHRNSFIRASVFAEERE